MQSDIYSASRSTRFGALVLGCHTWQRTGWSGENARGCDKTRLTKRSRPGRTPGLFHAHGAQRGTDRRTWPPMLPRTGRAAIPCGDAKPHVMRGCYARIYPPTDVFTGICVYRPTPGQAFGGERGEVESYRCGNCNMRVQRILWPYPARWTRHGPCARSHETVRA